MPKESVQISQFAGMVGVVEERDLPPGIAVYAKNLNMVTQEGAFEPLPNDDSVYAISGGVAGGKLFIPFSDGTKAAYHSGTALLVVANLNTTPATATLQDDYGDDESIVSGDESGVSDGEGVHFGLGGSATKKPIWLGKPQYGQFGGAAPINIVKTYANLSAAPLSQQGWIGTAVPTMTTEQSLAVYVGNNSVVYLASLVYDGYQEGPVMPVARAGIYPTGNEVGASKVDITVRVIVSGGTGEENLSKRVSGVNLYRQVTTYQTVDGNWVGLQSNVELVAQADLTAASGWTDTSWSSYVGKKYTFEDNGWIGREYEDRVGVSPVVNNWDVHYGLSVAADSFHIVGDIWHKDMGYKPNMLIRSKYGRYDTFDWSTDYLTLPTTPRALAHFAGRTYAFGRGRTYVIDPNGLRVEETWEGIGGLHTKAVVVCDRGMFWCDETNIYWHDGARMRPIATAVMTNKWLAAAGWQGSTVSGTNLPSIVYSAKYDSVIVFYTSGGTTYGLMFHVGTERWVHLTCPSNGVLGGAFTGPSGEAFYAVAGQLYRFATASANRTWQFVSHNLVQDTGRKHVFYHAIISWDGSAPTVNYYQNDPNYATVRTWASTSADGPNITRGEVNVRTDGTWDGVKDFSLRIDGLATQTVNDITIIQRRLTPR